MFAIRNFLAGSIAAILFGLVGCASAPQGWVPVPFNDAEYSAFKTPGTGAIKGQVFAKTKGGDVKKGAGDNVYLMPATSFGTQRYQEEFKQGKRVVSDPDPRHATFVLKKTADGEGRFEFTNVPEGKYYGFSTLTWEVPRYSELIGWTTDKQGGLAVLLIDVKNGFTSEAMLTP